MSKKPSYKTVEADWKWYPRLYIGAKAGKKKDEIIARLEAGEIEEISRTDAVMRLIDEVKRNLVPDSDVPDVAEDKKEAYVITIAEQSANLLDLFPEHSLMQEYYRRKCIYIMGIAIGYKEAVDTASKILADYFARSDEYQETPIRNYFFGDDIR